MFSCLIDVSWGFGLVTESLPKDLNAGTLLHCCFPFHFCITAVILQRLGIVYWGAYSQAFCVCLHNNNNNNNNKSNGGSSHTSSNKKLNRFSE